jgi:hypothetical protein
MLTYCSSSSSSSLLRQQQPCHLPFYKVATTMPSLVAEPCISTNPSTPFTPSSSHIGASATCGSSSSSGDDLSYYLPSPSRTARSPWRFLKPILPPSTFFIPGYEGLQSDDSHDTEEEEERDDTPVRNCHNGGRDDITDDSTNRDIVNNKATKPIQTIRRSLRPSIRRSLRPHGKPTIRQSKRLIEFERSNQHPPSSKVSEPGKPRCSVRKMHGQGHGRELHFSTPLQQHESYTCCLFKSSRQEILPLSPTDSYSLNKYLLSSAPENIFNRSAKNIDVALNPSLWTRDKNCDGKISL